MWHSPAGDQRLSVDGNCVHTGSVRCHCIHCMGISRSPQTQVLQQNTGTNGERH